jgi:hypothetical protein
MHPAGLEPETFQQKAGFLSPDQWGPFAVLETKVNSKGKVVPVL